MKNINNPITQNKATNLLLTAMALVFMCACSVSKDTALPANAFPDSYRGAEPSGTGLISFSDTTSISSMPWSAFFSTPELNALLAQAIAHNYDLQVAIKDINAAGLVLKQAKLGNVPSLGIQATGTYNRPSDNSLNGLSLNAFDFSSKHIEDYTLAGNLSWEADIWGKIRNRTAASLAAYLQSSEAKKLIQTRIVSDVAKGYYNLLMLDEQLEIARRNVRLNDSTLDMIRLQFDAGQATSLAIQQAEAQKLSAAQLIPAFEQQISIQENAISILIGIDPGAITRSSSLYTIPLGQTLSAGIPAQLLGHRPDIRFYELALSRANAEVGYTKASMYPSLAITAQGGLDAIKASNWFNIPASLFGTATAGLVQPLFQQKRLRTQFELAKVNREQAVLRFRHSVLVGVADVSDNLTKLKRLKERGTYAEQRMQTLQLAIGNSQQLFSKGLANYLEVITAQGNVLQSQLELAAVKKDQLDAQVDLYRAVGGGWW